MRIFKTSDLSCAAALCASGNEIIDMKHGPTGRVEFCFRASGQLKVQVDRYWKRELQVEAMEFFQSIKHIKNLIYNKQ